VIQYQFVQLFSNLLINAIKYRRPEVAPRIVISAAKIPVGQCGLPPVFKESHYWKIRVQDNGMGFDQNHADRIFQLFQRLSTNGLVEGTGIGLPICKKIVQNHEGYILAEGTAGVGAAFDVYLPATAG
jgi:signal transduction histidine kinase